MPDVTVAADFGASLVRAIFSLNSQSQALKPELMLIAPQVLRVPFKSIENYEKYKLGNSTPENSAWVKLEDDYYAVGHLAKTHFNAVHCLESLKIDSAIPQLLAIVGGIAQSKQMGNSFSLSLGILLPWGEYTDRERFEIYIKQALSGFCFRGKEYFVTLESFTCLPEGAGLFARGRVPHKGGDRLRNARELNIAVLMIGYRNASILFIEKGALSWGCTENYGFSRMIEKVQQFTSGQKAEKLVEVICSGSKPSKRAVAGLVRTNMVQLREQEMQEIAAAIADAKQEYIAILTNWLRQRLPDRPDEIIVNGGTARYLQPELTQFFKSLGAGATNWCNSLDERVVKTFGDLVRAQHLQSRLLDAYGLFFQLHNRPLPRLRDTIETAEGAHHEEARVS